MQKHLAVLTTQGDHHSWLQPGVSSVLGVDMHRNKNCQLARTIQHHWKWKIGECTIEQAVYSAYLLFTSIV